ncbi:uncharacterized protein CLUP02_09433 [Colletotrichum lupini]|uniref:Uncharacterized protein n=1 Tax=Colletotrichum lupini TaxID=145971 RepID=A0A9Q8SUR3_9PEZI|nr:uncharacterized protein CLUP02_09433 [Colletotrichum lupini]UQC83937.1 hypothetical protein CLUP02_09433 [Colletotrichum lupini]
MVQWILRRRRRVVLERVHFNSGGPVFESGSGRPLFFRIFLVYY